MPGGSRRYAGALPVSYWNTKWESQPVLASLVNHASVRLHECSPPRLADAAFDLDASAPNNAGMAKPEISRRIKSYSAATGYVYQYQFQEIQPSRRGLHAGKDYVYLVSVDRKTMFSLRVFVRRDAVEHWGKRAGRAMSGTEEYAVAKMRLFQAFDEIESLSPGTHELVVDESNLEALLAQLDL
jgi:hypothetical protein